MIDIDKMRAQLKEDLRQLGAKAEEIEEDLRSPKSTGWEDRATEIEDDDVLNALEGSALREIGEIRTALKRLDDGTYEQCTSCGKKIGEKRLAALPYAAQCIKCAEAG